MAMLCMLGCTLIPSVRFTEDRDTVRLARVIYALGRDESYETKLALGTVVMNRVENDWFPDTLGEVLRDQQQFPSGTRYDDASLNAAHAVLAGERALPEEALYYQYADTSAPAERIAQSGAYSFYATPSGRRAAAGGAR